MIESPHLSRRVSSIPAHSLRAKPWLPRLACCLRPLPLDSASNTTRNTLLPGRPRLLTSPQVRELRRQEGMDPPVPANVLGALDAAEGDLRLLSFKYAALAVAHEKRPPPPPPSETSQGGGSGGGGGETTGEGGGVEEGLSEEDLRGLLEEHVRKMIFSACLSQETWQSVALCARRPPPPPIPICAKQLEAKIAFFRVKILSISWKRTDSQAAAGLTKSNGSDPKKKKKKKKCFWWSNASGVLLRIPDSMVDASLHPPKS